VPDLFLTSLSSSFLVSNSTLQTVQFTVQNSILYGRLYGLLEMEKVGKNSLLLLNLSEEI
jgi:hypothetical protein